MLVRFFSLYFGRPKSAQSFSQFVYKLRKRTTERMPIFARSIPLDQTRAWQTCMQCMGIAQYAHSHADIRLHRTKPFFKSIVWLWRCWCCLCVAIVVVVVVTVAVAIVFFGIRIAVDTSQDWRSIFPTLALGECNQIGKIWLVIRHIRCLLRRSTIRSHIRAGPLLGEIDWRCVGLCQYGTIQPDGWKKCAGCFLSVANGESRNKIESPTKPRENWSAILFCPSLSILHFHCVCVCARVHIQARIHWLSVCELSGQSLLTRWICFFLSLFQSYSVALSCFLILSYQHTVCVTVFGQIYACVCVCGRLCGLNGNVCFC